MNSRGDLSSSNLYRTKFKRKRNNQEDSLQIAVIEYIRFKYPKAIYVSTYLNGARQKSLSVMKKSKKMGLVSGIPDLLIFHSGKFLALELKASGVKLFTKIGNLVSDKHIRNQYEIIAKFRGNNFPADFAVGFEDARKTIDFWIGEKKCQ